MQQGLAYELSSVMPTASLTGLFSSLCTIQAPSAAFVNGVPDGSYTNVAGLVNIPCQDAPPSPLRLSTKEQDGVTMVVKEADRHVLLNGFYAQFASGLNWGGVKWRAIVDGVTYALEGAEIDSQNTQVRLSLNLVSV
jgi:hypothetical protein